MNVLSHFAQSADYYTDYNYNYDYTPENAAAAVVLGGMFLVFTLILALIGYAVHAFLLGRIFKKAGVDQWIAWVPFYNGWKMLELGGQQGFWAVLAIIPVVNIVSLVFMYIAMYNIGLKLQKEGWFVVLAIFLPLVWVIWLAFDSSKWNESKGAASLTPVATGKDKTAVAKETK